ncbi:hypothetical protein Tco_0097326 [Tanacetum coccineum]
MNKRQMQTQESKVNMGKALDAGLVVTESSRTKPEKHDTSSRSGNDTHAEDADSKPINEKEPMAKVQSPKTRNSNKPIEQISHTQTPVWQLFTGHRFSRNKSSAVYEKTSPRSCLRWKPMGRIFNTVGLRSTNEAFKTAHGVSAANFKNNASTLPNVDSLSDAVISSSLLVGLTCDGFGYDWSNQAEEGPTNLALMAYTSSGSSSSSSSNTEVSTCSKACLKSYETLKEHYDNLTKDFSKSQLNVRAYKPGLESVEARLDVYKKNKVIFEEEIKILKLDIMLRDNALIELRKKFEKAKKEKDDLKLNLEKFENSSKNLSKLLDSQVSENFKTDVGYDSQVFDSQENDKYKIGEGYHAVPHPYTGNFMPPKPDLVLADEYGFSESVTSVPVVATSKVKTSQSKSKSVCEPLIKDWISDSENENETESKSRQRKPSNAKVEFVKTNEHVKSPRESVKKVENNKQAKFPRKNSQSPRGNKRN